MNLAWRRLKTYVRVSVIGIVFAALAIVLFMNRRNQVNFWFFGLTDATKPVNVLWIVLSTATVTRTITYAARFTRGLWRDIKELRRVQSLEETEREHARREVELTERKKQLEQMVIPGAPGGEEADRG